MAFSLGRAAAADGYRLAAFDTVGSTSTEALARARAGDPGRLWVVAREQTAGHGRRGRPWETASGNLAASLLLVEPAHEGDQPALLGFVAGLALAEAIASVAPGLSAHAGRDGFEGAGRLKLKWPNDVLVDGAKLAGILLEAVTLPGGVRTVVIGMGVNVLRAPEGTPYPATSLAAAGAATSAEALFAALSDAWIGAWRAWAGGRGFEAIRRRWLDQAAGLGAPIAVRLGDGVLSGTFETLDDDGRLVVKAADGSIRKITAGDVHFGTAATAGA
jgi:BirA family biotin operon repressor/biotin-[acetyl-CoA-carboxylase] ligase